MNVLVELRESVCRYFSLVAAVKIRTAFNSLPPAGGTGKSVTSDMPGGRSITVIDTGTMHITAAPDQDIHPMPPSVADFLCAGESLADAEKIRETVTEAENNRWTDYTIQTAKSLYYIHAGAIAGHWRVA